MQFKNIYNVELTKPLEPINLRSTFLSQDNLGNRIGIRVFENGEPYALSGGCSGLVQRNDGNTVTVPGVVSGNTAYIDLPESAYAVAGPVVIAIKVVTGDTTTTGLLGYGTVVLSSTGAYIDPGKAVPDVTQIVALYNQMQTATTAAESATAAANTAAASANASAARASGVSVITQYYLSTSNQTPTGGTWQDTVPEYAAGKYYWTRQKTVYGDGSSATGTAYPLQPFTNAQNAAQYVAPAETSPAAAAHAAGEYLIYNGALYTAAAPIAAGDALTVGGNILAASKGLGGKLDRLNSAVKAEALHPIYDNEMDGLYINGSVWDSAAPQMASFGIFPVKSAGTLIYITGNGTTSTMIAALRSHPAGAVAGDSVDFSQASGWTSIKSISKTGALSDVLPDDCQYLYVYYGLNNSNNGLPKTFMLNGQNMYASAGDTLNDMKKQIDGIRKIDLLRGIAVRRNVTSNGITFTWDDEKRVCTANGTNTGADGNPPRNVLLNNLPIDGFLQKNMLYAVVVDSSNDSLFCRTAFLDENFITISAYSSFAASVPYYIYVPHNAKFVNIRLQVSLNTTVENDTISVEIRPVKRSEALMRIPCCTYNVGRYNYGHTPGADHPMQDQSIIIGQMKAFFRTRSFDLFALQEGQNTIGSANAKQVLYDNLYGYSTTANTTAKPYSPSLYSKLPIVISGSGMMSGDRPYAWAIVNVGGIPVYVLSVHLALTLEQRLVNYDEIKSLVAPYEYFIVMGDFNAGNGVDGYDAQPEYDILLANGWRTANGGYWGQFVTLAPAVEDNPEYQRRLDTIVTSANITINTADAPYMRTSLPSDHRPLICELTLLPPIE